MPFQRPGVPLVGLPERVEDPADGGHRPDDGVDAHYREHLRERPSGRAQPVRLRDRIEREHRGDGVPRDGDDAQYRVETEPNVGARDPDGVVQQPTQRARPPERRRLARRDVVVRGRRA